jgi:TfoX/Sxy family transcriptional regulator of competence genes
MAYDEQLAARVRALLKGQRALVEKKMFGGLAYMSQGKIFVGILEDNLVVRAALRPTTRC